MITTVKNYWLNVNGVLLPVVDVEPPILGGEQLLVTVRLECAEHSTAFDEIGKEGTRVTVETAWGAVVSIFHAEHYHPPTFILMKNELLVTLRLSEKAR